LFDWLFHFEMTDFTAIQVFNFSGRREDWQTLSENFLAKVKRSGIKDVLLGNIAIPKSSNVVEEKTKIVKK
jgi:hypothetical protein